MTTNVRTFLREFAAFKARARRGGTVRIRDKEGEFLFTAVGHRQTLLGAARGKIRFPHDLTRPTLPPGGLEAVAVKSRLKYLLDTHAFLWAAADEERLGAGAAAMLASTPYEQLAIVDVTLQEIGLLLHAGRINFAGSPAAVLGRMLDHVQVLPITLPVAVAAPALPLPHGDQFDRVITATAKVHRLTLVTKDANITDAGIVPVLW